MTSTDTACPHVPPLRLPAFRSLWSGGLVSLAGTQMQFVALPYFVYEQTGSAFATALCAATQALPGVTLAPLAGAAADRLDSRRLLITANTVLAAVTLAFCLTVVAPWWVVLPVALVQAVAAQLIAPAEVVLTPSLVPAASLPAAGALVGASSSLARLVGPAAGGLLYAAAGLPAVAVANSLSFALAAVLIRRISSSRPLRAGRTGPSAAVLVRPPVPPGGGWTAGWAEIQRSPLLRRLLIAVVLTGVGEGCVSALLAPYASEVFGSSSVLGLLLTCQAGGGLIGALAVSRWAVLDRMPQVMGASAVVCGALLAVMISYPLLYPELWPALLLITAAGVPFAAVAAAELTLQQTLPRPVMRGRVFGVMAAAGGGAHLFGILIAGYAADRSSVYFLLADALCYLLAGLVIIRHRATDDLASSGDNPASPP